jgi:hypothetical protein
LGTSWPRGLAGGEPCRKVGVEVAGGDACGLDRLVDGVDVVVRRGDDCDAAAGLVMIDPPHCQPVEVIVERSGDDPAVSLIGIEAAWVTGSQL